MNSVIANNDGTLDLTYDNRKYSRDVLAGALGNFTLELNNNNRISFKNIININSSDYLIDRYNGRDFILWSGQVTPSGRRRSVFAKIHSSTRNLWASTTSSPGASGLNGMEDSISLTNTYPISAGCFTRRKKEIPLHHSMHCWEQVPVRRAEAYFTVS